MSVREDALNIYAAAVEAVLPGTTMRRNCRLEGDRLLLGDFGYDLTRYRRLWVFGSGKAAGTMAEALEEILGARIDGGLIVVPKGTNPSLRHIEVTQGSHPVPDASSLESGRRLKAAMEACDATDLYIYLLSGGSSALMELPLAPVTLEEFGLLTALMLRAGLDIGRVNTVRKHLSGIKGGRLGASCPAEGAVLVVSDVIGDDLEAIGSAPLYCDRTTFKEARSILMNAGIYDAAPASVRDVLDGGCRGAVAESPKAPLERIRHQLVGSNAVAVAAAAEAASRLGYDCRVRSEPLQGDADAAAPLLLAEGRALKRRSCLLLGGETTVEVRGAGRGGRNQQLCLRALSLLDASDRVTLLCAGTDGIDGNSHAAGAVIDRRSLLRTREAGLDLAGALEANDATGFFEGCGGLIVTGPSGTNVMDVAILITDSD